MLTGIITHLESMFFSHLPNYSISKAAHLRILIAGANKERDLYERVSLKHAKDSHRRSTWTAVSNHGGRASGGAAWPEQAAGCADTDIPTHHVSAPGK